MDNRPRYDDMTGEPISRRWYQRKTILAIALVAVILGSAGAVYAVTTWYMTVTTPLSVTNQAQITTARERDFSDGRSWPAACTVDATGQIATCPDISIVTGDSFNIVVSVKNLSHVSITLTFSANPSSYATIALPSTNPATLGASSSADYTFVVTGTAIGSDTLVVVVSGYST